MTDLTSWLEAHPQFTSLRLATCDVNAVARGKRLPSAHASKIASGGARMPLSALNCDIEGSDIDGSPLVFDTGDADGVLIPTDRGPMPAPWLTDAAFLPMMLNTEQGDPFMGDPRHVLARTAEQYRQKGWRAVVATELEFFLTDPQSSTPHPPRDPLTDRHTQGTQILSLEELDRFEPFFNDLYAGCEAMGIPADAATSEAANGQFEINLMHVDDMMRAADDTWFFKLLVRGLARKHGLRATFAAKPFAEESGNGLHVHFSVLDEQGNNIFNDGGPEGTDLLKHAIAGCLSAMPASQLVLAPHGNSFARFTRGAHAPVQMCWGYENRTSALRVPGGAPVARRIEHRVAGGDVNPYLLLSMILGAALMGIEETMTPPDPITGNAFDLDLPELDRTWRGALDRFENDPMTSKLLPRQMIENLIWTKRQEITRFAPLPPDEQASLYTRFL